MSDKDQLVGKTIGSYRIIKCLGKGGMGAVYHGEHPQIESNVAIKVLLPRFVSSAEIVRRFFDEARAVNRIGHPGIVRIHDCNKHEEVGVYLVMELLEGESLSERSASNGTLPWKMVCRLVCQTASALAASHDTGIIHRDLKPANIFVVPDPDMPGGERIKILDFGIAKLLEQDEPLDGGTKTGMIIGSPMYMSPEQCIDSKGVDLRTDIYSLGAIAYRLLSGSYPFEADTLGKLIIKQQSERPEPLSTLQPEVPRSVAQVIEVALATDREDRYADMVQLRDALLGAEEQAEAVSAEMELTGPPARRPGARADLALLETALEAPASQPEPEPEPEQPAAANSDTDPRRQQTTLSGTVGEKSGRHPVVQPPAKAGRRLPFAVGTVVVLGAALAVVLHDHRQQPPPVDRPGPTADRAGAALARTPQAAAASPAAPAVPEPRPDPVQAAPQTPSEPAPKSPPARARLTLELSPPNTRVLLDGAQVTENPLTLTPGRRYKLTLEAAGHRSQRRSISASTDETIKITLQRALTKKRTEPAAQKRPPPVKSEPKPKKPRGKRVYFRNL